MKIEAGKYYMTSEGRKVGPMERELDRWEANGNYYDGDGVRFMISFTREWDIIAQWHPEVGTLEEIGSDIGDVVAMISVDGSGFGHIGKSHTIQKDGRVMLDGGNGKHWGYINDQYDTNAIFRIITKAAAPPQPVRIVTRKEIVPGVYGRVLVDTALRVSMGCIKNSSDLTAAIETLTQIRDAME